MPPDLLFWTNAASITGLFVNILVPLLLSWSVLGKTGLSRLWTLLCLVPAIGPIVLLLVLVCKRWPVHRELACLRVLQGVADVQDATAVMEDAMGQRKSGRLEEARARLLAVAERFPNTQQERDARLLLEELSPVQRQT